MSADAPLPAPPAPPSRPPARSSALFRYGPLALVLTGIIAVAVLASVGGGDGTDVSAGTASSTTVADPTANPDLPMQYAAAKKAGDLGRYDWGTRCDPRTGRLKIPTIFSPPCVPVFKGDNGGATSPGVTATTIKVVAYIPKGTDLAAALQGLSDSDAKQTATRKAFAAMLGDLYETYGRTVEIVPFVTTANGDDEEKAKADAIEVAEEYKPFASLGGPSLTSAYADELAARKVVCIGCGISVPDSTFQKNAPYMWGPTPTPEQYLLNLGDYVTGRLVGRDAAFAGDPALRGETRVFGVVHFEQDPPVFGGVEKIVAERGKGQGYEAKVNETYTLDVAKLGERAATIIAKLKDAGVTTVIFLGDPIMPKYLTAEATAQGYFPEWVVTGTVLTDTTVFGRQYDPKQWAHAFGISNLAARTPKEQQEPWRLHEWYYGRPPTASNTSAVIYPGVANLLLGIHMAGPHLTPETFQGGLFSYPPTGGGPTTPRISYGDHGLFVNPDYLGIDDVTEIWWDPAATGPDEQGKTAATGMWRYSDGGRRYVPGTMPKGPPHAFRKAGSVTIYDTPPPQDRAPRYPSPR